MLFLEAYDSMLKTGGSGAFLFLDFEKAFDRIDRDFLWTTMHRMNFGQDFISYCQTLYAKSNTTVLVNGHTSPRVEVCTGVRQGCPIAALLYLIACEPMANMFRADPAGQFSGQPLPRSQAFDTLRAGQGQVPVTSLCISQYCDDTLLYCRNAADVRRAVEILKLYEAATGQKINYSKSPAMYIAMDPPDNIPFATLSAAATQSCLGLNVGENVNYGDEWKKRVSSLHGTLVKIVDCQTQEYL